MPQKDFVSWNAIINCFVRNGNCVESLEMLKEMYEFGFVPKPELLAGVLSLSVRCGCTMVGKMIHSLSIVDERFEKMVFLSTALVDFYWRSGDSVMAFRVFDSIEDKNEVSWTSMIVGYVGNREYLLAFDCFRKMQAEGIKPNRVTLITVLPTCIEIGSFRLGKDVHGYAFRHGFNSDLRLLSALINLYSKRLDSIPLAKKIFESSTQKDVVIWSSVISGFAQHSESAENSISVFNQMRESGFEPNDVTLLAILAACTNIPSINLGSGIHGYALKSGFDSNLSIKNSLINTYSKCGSLKDSHRVFLETSKPGRVSWSAIINAYGVHGFGEKALRIFNYMKESGTQPDSITLLSVLSACNHSGLVEEGRKVFLEALEDVELSVNLEHYACYIDLLGRAGEFECVGEVLRMMPMKASPKIMSSVVSACKVHGRLDVAETFLSWFIESEPGDAANLTLLSLVYGEFGKWLNVEGVRRDMKTRGLRKSYGFSRLES